MSTDHPEVKDSTLRSRHSRDHRYRSRTGFICQPAAEEPHHDLRHDLALLALQPDPSTNKNRAGSKLRNAMNRCLYPRCTGNDEHEGDHTFDRPLRPIGTIRLIQQFHGTLSPPCDVHNIPRVPKATIAIGLYVDDFRFVWALCYDCVSQCTVKIGEHILPPKPPGAPVEANDILARSGAMQPDAKPAHSPSVATKASSRVAKKATVLDFAARERGLR